MLLLNPTLCYKILHKYHTPVDSIHVISTILFKPQSTTDDLRQKKVH